MPGTSTVSASSSQDINGLLSGVKWATTSLTYSFPTSAADYSYSTNGEVSSFGALSAGGQAAVQAILDMYESVTNLSFTALTGAQSGQGDLRFADSDAPNTAWGYYPSLSSAGGDVWFHKSGTYGGYYDTPAKGDYGYFTYIHEIGHALGLKHGHETDTYGALPSSHDGLEYSVMTYRSYPGAATGSGYTNEFDGFPQTLMQNDIAALQHMYGADFGHNGGNTVYSWSTITGETFINGAGQGAPAANKIFMTVWDGGGTDTYDFSNYGVSITADLAPGGWITFANSQRADLGDGHTGRNIANALLYQGDTRSLIENAIGGSAADTITGNTAANVLEGRGGGDTLDGLGGDDTLIGGAGGDILRGSAGTDTASYTGSIFDYALRRPTGTTFTVADQRSGTPDGSDTLDSVEHLAFADYTATAFTTDGSGWVTKAEGSGFAAFFDQADLQDWTRYLETYNGGGQRLTQTGAYDDGTSWANYWDPGNGFNYTSYSEHYTAGGAISARIGTYDTGESWANYWDPAGQFNYVSYSEHYVVGGTISARVGAYDSGESWANYWDPNSQFNYVSYSEHYVVGGAISARVGTYDSGESWANYWDPSNLFNYSSYSEHYVVGGAIAARVGTYDSGESWANYWDPSNQFNYASYSEHYLVGGARSAQVGTYDNGESWKNFWDPNDAQAWQTINEHYNALGAITTRITTWDDGTQTQDWFL